jgi:hypothetical protein
VDRLLRRTDKLAGNSKCKELSIRDVFAHFLIFFVTILLQELRVWPQVLRTR